MATKTPNIELMLRTAFLKRELEFLKPLPEFSEALPLVKTAFQFERLCRLGEELLSKSNHANPAAKQFRQSSRGASKSQLVARDA